MAGANDSGSQSQLPSTKWVGTGAKCCTVAGDWMSPQWRMSSTPRVANSRSAASMAWTLSCVSLRMPIFMRLLFLPRCFHAGDLQFDAIQADVDCDVKRRFLLAGAETAIARDADRILRSALRQARRDESDLHAIRVGDQHAGALQAALREIEIALLVDGHAVEAVLLAEVDQRAPGAVDEAVVAERKSVELHRALLLRIRRFVEAFVVVVVIDDVERAIVGAQRDAVRLLGVVRDFDDGSVGVDAVDGEVLELALLRPKVLRVAEIDAALVVDRQVVRGVEALAHVRIS